MTRGDCPSCGASVDFTAVTALVVVCGRCRTQVSRAGDTLEAKGQVEAPLATDSPIHLGMSAAGDDPPFRVVGRVQRDYGEGRWDEWYLEHPDGRGAWLTEMPHLWLRMFPGGTPTFHAPIALRSPVSLGAWRFVVERIGVVKTLAAEGELPGPVQMGQEVQFVDGTNYSDARLSVEFGSGAEPLDVFTGAPVYRAQLFPVERTPRPAGSVRKSTAEIRAAVLAACGEQDRAAGDNRYTPDRGRALGGKFASRAISAASSAIHSVSIDQPPEAYVFALETALHRAHSDSYDGDDEDHAGPGAINGVIQALKRVLGDPP